jgi:hypothetical protein
LLPTTTQPEVKHDTAVGFGTGFGVMDQVEPFHNSTK